MKRRTRLIIIGCATVGGTLTTAAQAASATPTILDEYRVQKPVQGTETKPVRHPIVHRSRPAPLPTIKVQAGDSLSAVAARVSRTWLQLAARNHIANPDLIYPGQVLIVPPATYIPAATASSPPVTYQHSPAYGTPSAWHQTNQVQRTTTTYAPAISASGVWGCIAAHESSGVASANTGNGYYGLYQDTQSSWVAGGGLAYAPRADLASAAAQTAVNQHIQAQQGWAAWPISSSACGA
jgi:LysM repeat protein